MAVLAPAWCYVLSAKWLEAHTAANPKMAYTEHKPPMKPKANDIPTFQIRTGFNDARRLQWLSSILQPSTENRFTFASNDGLLHWSPWSVSLAADDYFSISTYEGSDLSLEDGLNISITSSEAIGVIRDICVLNQIPWMQIEASLGIALLVPLHRALGIPLRLPPPSRVREYQERPPNLDLQPLSANLPSLMTFSSCYELINSTICGAFWNPAVSSNLLSPWVQALGDVYNALNRNGLGHPDELFAPMGARRAPSIGILFIAAAVTGLLPTVFTQICSGQPPLERHACAFTGLPQSFMDVAGSGDYGIDRASSIYLRRSDCWRLRRLPPPFDDGLHYSEGPFSPWEPPGECLASNCPLRVRAHLACSRHSWTCQSFAWQLNCGRRVTAICHTTGPTPSFLEAAVGVEDPARFGGLTLRNDNASFDATVTVFRWVLDNDEGTPSEGAYQDPWLLGINEYSDVEDSTCGDDCVSDSMNGKIGNLNHSVEKWFNSGNGSLVES